MLELWRILIIEKVIFVCGMLAVTWQIGHIDMPNGL